MSGRDTASVAEVPLRPWALLAYLCGDNATMAAHVKAQVDAVRSFAGSPHLHVALQYDLPGTGASRMAQREDGAWDEHALGRVNSGARETWLDFFRWALDRCPSDRVIVVVTGTGLLDPRAAYGNPEVDRTHLFTVCEDDTDKDALRLSEFGTVLREALVQADRDAIDVLALDMRELQCLEVAYEIDGCARLLVAPQTRIPDEGWDYAVVLSVCAAALQVSGGVVGATDMARVVLHAAADGYETRRAGTLALSVLDLSALADVAAAFDTLSLAMLHSLGDELVWRARAAVVDRLKPPASSASAAGTGTDGEAEYLYDLPELLDALAGECRTAARTGLVQLVTEYLGGLDRAALQRTVGTLEAACFGPGARLRRRELREIVALPAATRRQLRGALATVVSDWTRMQGRPVASAFAEVFTAPASLKDGRHSWLEDWPDAVIGELDQSLAAVFRVARQQQARLSHMTALVQRVVGVLGVSAASPRVSTARPLVVETITRTPPGTAGRHGGVSLFRPRNLDHLVASDYLDLRFNRSIHWTVLLAVINMIGSHPRALWRILSAVLATADSTTRAQLLERITGPDSVIGSYRQQFVVLAPARALVLTLESDPDAPRGSSSSLHGAVVPAETYRVRLEQADRDAVISEVISHVDGTKLGRLVDALDALLQSPRPMERADAREIDALGRTLGEDILQDLGRVLGQQATRGPLHLQLQIPRSLMKYPWELMHHQRGWLLQDFAVGRQVFSRATSRITSARQPGPLRALVIGNPQTTEVSLAFAAHEAQVIADRLATLASETDGLLDFVPARDLFVDVALSSARLRQLLREGQYDVIHFAGHARFDPNDAGGSAWVLTDGPLTAREIRNTLAWADTHPWLVFANACQAAGANATYQGEGFGLASAFLDHGVNAFIGPLWPIADDIAAETASQFYTHLLKERRTVGQALHLSRRAMKARYFDPVESGDATASAPTHAAVGSWAGLVLYGNATATIAQRLGAPPPAAHG